MPENAGNTPIQSIEKVLTDYKNGLQPAKNKWDLLTDLHDKFHGCIWDAALKKAKTNQTGEYFLLYEKLKELDNELHNGSNNEKKCQTIWTEIYNTFFAQEAVYSHAIPEPDENVEKEVVYSINLSVSGRRAIDGYNNAGQMITTDNLKSIFNEHIDQNMLNQVLSFHSNKVTAPDVERNILINNQARTVATLLMAEPINTVDLLKAYKEFGSILQKEGCTEPEDILSTLHSFQREYKGKLNIIELSDLLEASTILNKKNEDIDPVLHSGMRAFENLTSKNPDIKKSSNKENDAISNEQLNKIIVYQLGVLAVHYETKSPAISKELVVYMNFMKNKSDYASNKTETLAAALKTIRLKNKGRKEHFLNSKNTLTIGIDEILKQIKSKQQDTTIEEKLESIVSHYEKNPLLQALTSEIGRISKRYTDGHITNDDLIKQLKAIQLENKDVMLKIKNFFGQKNFLTNTIDDILAQLKKITPKKSQNQPDLNPNDVSLPIKKC